MAESHNPARPAGEACVVPPLASLPTAVAGRPLSARSIEVQAKPWGRLETFYRDDSIEIAYAYIEAGGFCSRHVHERKSNDFLVISGALTVCVRGGSAMNWSNKKHRLTASGSSLHIPAGVLHWFEADRDCVVLETYRAIPGERLDPADIRRVSESGKRKVA